MQIDWNKNPLIPAIAQDHETSQVLMLAYMNEEGIELTTTESFFPNVAKFSEIDLSEVPGKFKQFKAAEEYVFYSNVYNLSDSEYELFQDTYEEIKRFSQGAIYVALYQRKR